MKQDGITRGPWTIEGPDQFGDFNIHHPADRLAIGAVVSNLRPSEEVAANAHFIVAACNAYEPMREALAKKNAEIARLRTALEQNGSMDFFRDGAKHMHDAIVSQKFHVDWGTAATPSSGAALAFDLTKDLAAKTLAALSTLPVNDRHHSGSDSYQADASAPALSEKVNVRSESRDER